MTSGTAGTAGDAAARSSARGSGEAAGHVWGAERTLSSWESLMWRADGGDPRTRSTGVLLEVLAEAPDWARLRREIAGMCERLPRLRSRIVEPPLPVVAPRWAPDPDFDIGYHLRRVRLPGDGSDAELLDQVDDLMAHPLDRRRPPWEMTLITGLSGDRAALAFKVHHCLSDGQGLVQLIGLMHGSRADDAPAGLAVRVDADPDDATGAGTSLAVLSDGLQSALTEVPGAVSGAAAWTWRALGAGLGDPIGSGRRVAGYVSSLGRMVTPPSADRSPALRSDGTGYSALIHEVGLDELRTAARTVGCSVNDAFLAAILGAFRRHHERLGEVPARIPLAFPISVRTADDPEGGNRFAGVRFAAPLDEPDPVARMAEIRTFARAARSEPALAFLDTLAPIVALLPDSALTELSASLTASTDVQASNIPGPSHPVWLAGTQVTGIFPLGPRPGIAAMITMLTYDGRCCLGLTLDPRAVPDTQAFSECLTEGFGEVLALR